MNVHDNQSIPIHVRHVRLMDTWDLGLIYLMYTRSARHIGYVTVKDGLLGCVAIGIAKLHVKQKNNQLFNSLYDNVHFPI